MICAHCPAEAVTVGGAFNVPLCATHADWYASGGVSLYAPHAVLECTISESTALDDEPLCEAPDCPCHDAIGQRTGYCTSCGCLWAP